MLSKILSNIYLRNLALFFTLVALYTIQLIVLNVDKVSISQFGSNVFSIFVQYGYILFHNLILFEKLFLKRKYILYFLMMSFLLGFDYYTTSYWFTLIGESFSMVFMLNRFILYMVGIGAFFLLKYYQEKSKFRELQFLQKNSELNQLRSQLNPHFLYNALNNIYSYLLTNDDRKGKELILRLSELMRHITNVSDKKEIYLSESIDFLINYIAFEKERLGQRCNIILDINNTSDNLMIAPLIFFPLIENAFKHGTNSIKPVKIDIKIETERDILTICARNQILTVNSSKSTNMGIQNVRRSLELLYPGKHSLEIKKDDIYFEFLLKINLA
jgi:two-component system LytT family sensor kinase